MASRKDKLLLKKLKKQVRLLQRKNVQSRAKLNAALKKMRKMGRTHQTKLAKQKRLTVGKVGEARSAAYSKVASDLQGQLSKGINVKGRSIQSAINKIEKKHIAKLLKGLAKKGKKTKIKSSRPAAAKRKKIARRVTRKKRARRR